MDLYQQNKRIFTYTGLAVFGSLLLLALVFYQVRMLFCDPALHTFEIMREESFAIQVHRFGAVVTQAVPLLAYRLGLPLSWILCLYSGVFMLLYLLGFYWLAKRDIRAGILLVLSYVLFSNDLFYWAISEHQQAMLYTVGWFYALYRTKDEPLRLSLLAFHTIAFSWIIFLYPSSLFTIFYALIFAFLHQQKLSFRWLATLSALALGVMYFKGIYFKNYYDEGKYEQMQLGWAMLRETWILPSTRHFLQHCWQDYYAWVLLLIINALYYTKTKRWYIAIGQTGYMLGVAATVQILLYHGNAFKFYEDNMYFPLGFMVALPFLYDVLPNSRLSRYAVPILLTIIGIRFTHILIHSQPYIERYQWIKSVVERLRTYPERCFIATEADIPAHKLLLTWGICHETLLYASIDNPDEARTLLIVPNLNDYSFVLDTTQPPTFYTQWHKYKVADNRSLRTYFRLADTRYRVLTKSDLPQ